MQPCPVSVSSCETLTDMTTSVRLRAAVAWLRDVLEELYRWPLEVM